MPQESSARTVFKRKTNLRRQGLAVCVAVTSLGLSVPAIAATFTALHAFKGQPFDGNIPAGVVRDDDTGNLYGITELGGHFGQGMAFEFDSAGDETALANLTPENASFFNPGLIMHGNNLYATTNFGGLYGDGAVIKIDVDKGKPKVLYSFCSLASCTDGGLPGYGVTRDNAGNLYGTASAGGAYRDGVVFKVDPSGNETVLYNFCPNGGTCSDGTAPIGSGVLRDSAGNLYGYAQGGPSNVNCNGTGDPCGVVWKLDTSGNETVLHAFTGAPSDGVGGIFQGQLIMDGQGNLYGVTEFGGSGTECGYQNGCGTLFKIDVNGNETVLYSFTGGADGYQPGEESLVLDKKGNLYGTAGGGGVYGYGTVFKLDTSNTFTVLYNFQGQTDGEYPNGPMILDHGVLYGQNQEGGNFKCKEAQGTGCGVLFSVTLP